MFRHATGDDRKAKRVKGISLANNVLQIAWSIQKLFSWVSWVSFAFCCSNSPLSEIFTNSLSKISFVLSSLSLFEQRRILRLVLIFFLTRKKIETKSKNVTKITCTHAAFLVSFWWKMNKYGWGAFPYLPDQIARFTLIITNVLIGSEPWKIDR